MPTRDIAQTVPGVQSPVGSKKNKSVVMLKPITTLSLL
jgi:hypothetical protein